MTRPNTWPTDLDAASRSRSGRLYYDVMHNSHKVGAFDCPPYAHLCNTRLWVAHEGRTHCMHVEVLGKSYAVSFDYIRPGRTGAMGFVMTSRNAPSEGTPSNAGCASTRDVPSDTRPTKSTGQAMTKEEVRDPFVACANVSLTSGWPSTAHVQMVHPFEMSAEFKLTPFFRSAHFRHAGQTLATVRMGRGLPARRILCLDLHTSVPPEVGAFLLLMTINALPRFCV